MKELYLIPTSFFSSYEKLVFNDVEQDFTKVKEIEIKADTFNFYTSVSVITKI